MAKFVHLHTHSEFSLLDGASRIKNMIGKAKQLGMPAIALTDHGVMYGIIDFYLEAVKQGIKPIIGCEVYVAPGSRFDKTKSEESNSHLVLLAENEQGYRNLMNLVTLSYFDGFYYKPRVDKEILEKYHHGLIASTACLAGQIPRYLKNDDINAAKKEAIALSKIFGENNFFLEVQDHNIDEQKKVNQGIFEIGDELGIPIIATNDIHYINREDAQAHDVLLCIQTGSTLAEKDRLRFETDQFYLKSGDEMATLFPERPDVLANTVDIANRCNVEIKFNEYLLPKYEIPKGYTLDSYFEKLCREGFAKRYPNPSRQQQERLEYEIEMIKQMGFPGYFLVVQDFVRYAKSKGIKVGPGRGSAAGSIVAYVLEITNIDPITYDLLFERFLNPERISMPDIDIDFCFERRSEVIDYVTQKYGEDKVAQIITFGTMAARAAIRDVGRVFDIPYGRVDKIAKMIPEGFHEGKPWTIEGALAHVPELKEAYENDQEITRPILDMAKNIEGLVRQDSIHAAGVVISDQALMNRTPVQKKGDAEIVTQYDMGAIQKLGLLKMDFLGLRTLTVIDNAVKNIKQNRGLDIDIDSITFDDPKTYEMLQRGESIGVFQLESSGMRGLLRDLQPTVFSDIIALLALYRPGPLGSGMVKDFVDRKHGRKPISYLHNMLEDILKETYGVIVYQEQVMRIASTMAGFSMGEADILRKAMSKKEPEVLAKLKEKFVDGSVKNGVRADIASKIFDLIVHFAGYGFNKCVVGSTEVIDADTGAVVTVEELYRSGNRINTLSCDNKYKIVKRPVVDCVVNGYKPVYRVKTQLGYEITVTDNHPFLTIDGWKELKELGIGSRIAVPRVIPTFGKSSWPKHKLVILAGVLSEGNTCHPSGFYYYGKNDVQVNDFITNLEKFDNTRATIRRRRGLYEVYAGTGRDARFKKGQTPWNKIEKAEGVPVNGQNPRSGARLWLESLGLIGKNATEKFIPGEVFSLDQDSLATLIGRLWTGDGFLISSGTNKVPYYATSSRRMATQIQHLLLRFGIISRIAEKVFKYRDEERHGYALYLQGRESILRFVDIIGPHIIGRGRELANLISYYESIDGDNASRDIIPFSIKELVRKEKILVGLGWRQIERESGLSVKEFVGTVHSRKQGFRRSTIRGMADYFGSNELMKHATSDIYWDKIVEIEFSGIEQTYDLEIEGTHNFIANGLIVHNSHSTAYAFISYQTAWLKANYPVEFMAALLTSVMGNKDKVAQYVNECRRCKIEVLPPDVNESYRDFTIVGNSIRFGLTAVRNVGEGAIEGIIKERERGGPFKSIYDFCRRVDLSLLNKRMIESLIKAGAFDSFGVSRRQLLLSYDRAVDLGHKYQKDKAEGQFTIFDIGDGSSPDGHQTIEDPVDEVVPEFDKQELLAYEKEMLGLYVSDHPLLGIEEALMSQTEFSTVELKEQKDGTVGWIGGIITKITKVLTKKGDVMLFLNLEDLDGSVEVIVFPATVEKYKDLIIDDKLVLIKGRLDIKEDEVKVLAQEIVEFDAKAEGKINNRRQLKETGNTIKTRVNGASSRKVVEKPILVLNVSKSLMTASFVARLKEALSSHPGKVPVFLRIENGDKPTIMAFSDKYKVSLVNSLFAELKELLGEGSVEVREGKGREKEK
ncbi:MAG: DNA polymerase III subunit alpha [Actinomycetota bacterium]|nr:DNA polymerase III subunit alpha [Actinomycetota bacterium]